MSVATAGASSSTGADPAGVAAARAAIDATNLADPATLAAIDAIRFTDEGASAAAEALRSGATGDALWAATFVYATSGTDPLVLAPALASPDPSVRALGAAAALSLGQRDAARLLVALLPEAGDMRGSAPPAGIAAFALSTLSRYVEGPSVDPGEAPADVAGAWTAWLAAHEQAMHFDPASGKWRP